MGKEMIFLYKAIFFGLAMLLLIPKQLYRKYFIYGLLLGAIPNVILIGIISGIFHGFEYRNMGPFNIWNLFSFWTPLAWMFVFMFFFYCLPARKIFFYPYIISFSMFGYFVGKVLHNLGLYEVFGFYNYLAPFVFTGWFLGAALVYLKAERISLI